MARLKNKRIKLVIPLSEKRYHGIIRKAFQRHCLLVCDNATEYEAVWNKWIQWENAQVDSIQYSQVKLNLKREIP